MKRTTIQSLVIVAIAAVVIAVGWAIYREATEPDSGTVTGLTHRDAYSTTSCTGSGRTMSCSTTHHSECWNIDYQGSNGRSGDKCVPAITWDRYRIGDHYPAGAR